MNFTNFPSFNAARALPLVALAALPLVQAPFVADPYQPARALMLALALGLLMLGVRFTFGSTRGVVAAALAGTVFMASLSSSLLGGAASSVFGVHGRFQGMLSLGLFVIAGAVGFGLRPSGAESRLFARALGTVLVIESALLLIQRLIGMTPVGTMGNSVLAAGWLVTVASFVLGAAMGESKPWRSALQAAGWLGYAAVGVAATRGAWLAVLPVLALISVAARKSGGKRVAIGMVALLVGVLLAGPASASKVSATDVVSGSAGSRIEIWKGTARMIADHPVMGVGVGRFLYEYPDYQTSAHARIEGADTRTDQAHSVYLQQAAESGVPGAVALVALIALALWTGYAAARKGDALAMAACAGLAAWAAQAAFGISAVETDSLAWLFGGIALSRAPGVRLDSDVRAMRGRVIAVFGILACVTAAALSIWYLRADARYAASASYLSAARFSESAEAAQDAVARVPVVDSYRVALADSSAYLAAAGDPGKTETALSVVDRGLVLEPGSYDLAASRARLLALANTPDPQGTWDAYVYAMDLYPRGVAIRKEASSWARRAGSDEMQTQAAIELARVTTVTGP